MVGGGGGGLHIKQLEYVRLPFCSARSSTRLPTHHVILPTTASSPGKQGRRRGQMCRAVVVVVVVMVVSRRDKTGEMQELFLFHPAHVEPVPARPSQSSPVPATDERFSVWYGGSPCGCGMCGLQLTGGLAR